MGVQVIPILTEVVSHSLPFPFPFPILFYSYSHGISMGFPVPLGISFPCTSLMYIVQSSAGDEMTQQRVHRYGVVLVARSTLTVQRLQSCVDRNGLSSSVER